MKKNPTFWTCLAILFLPLFGSSQVTQPTKDSLRKADSLKLVAKDSSAIKLDTIIKEVPKTDTIKVLVDTVVIKDCYQQWLDAFRTRGAKAVPDGMQQVVIAFKGPDGCHC